MESVQIPGEAQTGSAVSQEMETCFTGAHPASGVRLWPRDTHARVSPSVGWVSPPQPPCRRNSSTPAPNGVCGELDTGGSTSKGGGAGEEAVTPLQCSTDHWRPKPWWWMVFAYCLQESGVMFACYPEQKDQTNVINAGRRS